jgi:hypothetical protein
MYQASHHHLFVQWSTFGDEPNLSSQQNYVKLKATIGWPSSIYGLKRQNLHYSLGFVYLFISNTN